MEAHCVGFESPQMTLPLVHISRARPVQGDLDCHVDPERNVRHTNVKITSEGIDSLHPQVPGVALIGQRGIMVSVADNPVPPFQRRIDHLIQMLAPVGQIEEQLSHWLPLDPIVAEQYAPQGSPEVGSSRLSSQKMRNAALGQFFAEPLGLNCLAAPLDSLKTNQIWTTQR